MAPEPALLASLLFLWQFPHFFALSYLHREDYARGKFEMVAVNDPAGLRSAGLIMEYSLYLTALPIIASVSGLTSYMFAFEGTAANLYLLYLANKFRQDRTNAGAKRVFLCSLWYLPLLMAGFLFHSTMWDKQTIEDEAKNDEVCKYLSLFIFISSFCDPLVLSYLSFLCDVVILARKCCKRRQADAEGTMRTREAA
jgi:protoheme IX farnesyltransferase